MASADGDTVASWFDAAIQVGDRVSWPTPEGSAARGAGDRFMLSRQHAEQLLDRLTAIIDDVDELRIDAWYLTRVQPPADDPVSEGFNEALIGSAGMYGVLSYAVGHIDRERAYVLELRRRLADALGTSVDTDDRNARRFPDGAAEHRGIVG